MFYFIKVICEVLQLGGKVGQFWNYLGTKLVTRLKKIYKQG